MYSGTCSACRLNGLGVGADWLSIGAALVGQGGRGAQQPGTAVVTTTNVSTQVSPQISPVFVQQQSPSNSPVNAGAAMSPTGFIPLTGQLPGFDPGVSLYGGMPPVNGMPSAPSMTPMLLIGAAALGVILLTGKRRRKGKR